jgi:adenylate cyclase
MAENFERRLAAILSADVFGYSKLMGADEEGTLARWTTHRSELIDLQLSAHRGRIVKLMGDGMLVEFSSVVDAVRCAVAIQRGMAARNEDEAEDRQIILRIGINLGDIIVEGDDIHGDGVNVAARLQELAAPGGVSVSGKVHDEVLGKVEAVFEDLGEKSVKNIAQPIRVYAVTSADETTAKQGDEIEALPLPSKPSIAVLPFDNMSGDPEQEYFADGIADDILTGLSRFHDLFVIARNSSFTYKGTAVDIKQVGRELGVRYVLEGVVRKAGNRVRITAQLIEADSGNHLWAEKYDGDLADIFDLQDEITASVVGAIGPSVLDSEIEKARRKRPDSLDAYELCMRGRAHQRELDAEGLAKAKKYFLQAIDRDDRLAQAFSGLAETYWMEALLGLADVEQSLAEALSAGRRAVEIDEAEATAHTWIGFAALVTRQHDVALLEVERAVELNPNNAMARATRGSIYSFTGRPQQGAEECRLALRLSPHENGGAKLVHGSGGIWLAAGGVKLCHL